MQISNALIKESRYLISELLLGCGFPLMSNHAQDEINVSVLKKYVKIIHREATKKNNNSLIEKLIGNKLI